MSGFLHNVFKFKIKWNISISFFFCRILFQSMEVSTFVYPFIFFFFLILTIPHSIWDPSSSTRDQTCVPCIGGQGLNHWTAREVSIHSSFDGHLGCSHFLTIVHNAGSLTRSWNFIMRCFSSILLVGWLITSLLKCKLPGKITQNTAINSHL